MFVISCIGLHLTAKVVRILEICKFILVHLRAYLIFLVFSSFFRCLCSREKVMFKSFEYKFSTFELVFRTFEYRFETFEHNF